MNLLNGNYGDHRVCAACTPVTTISLGDVYVLEALLLYGNISKVELEVSFDGRDWQYIDQVGCAHLYLNFNQIWTSFQLIEIGQQYRSSLNNLLKKFSKLSDKSVKFTNIKNIYTHKLF